MLVIEDILGRCAPLLGIDPIELRRRNFYVEGQATPYGQPVRHPERLVAAWEQVLDDRRRRPPARPRSRRSTPTHEHTKRGAGDDAGEVRHLVQLHRVQPGRRAGARLQGRLGADQPRRHRDGPGPAHQDAPGRRHDARACRWRRCGWPRPAPTRCPTPRPPRPAPGADLNGGAVKNACEQIRERLLRSPRLLGTPRRADRRRRHAARWRASSSGTSWSHAYFQRVQLWAAGFYRTEGLHWDSAAMHGLAVQVLRLRRRRRRGRGRRLHRRLPHAPGRHRPRRRRQPLAAGRPRPDRGRLRAGRRLADPGGPALGRRRRADAAAGWPPRPRAPTSCRASPRCPRSSTSRCSSSAHEDGAVYGSKAVGEPPLMLAFSVREALRAGRGGVRARRASASTSPRRPRPRRSTGRSSRRAARPSTARRRGCTGVVPTSRPTPHPLQPDPSAPARVAS